MNSMNSLLQIRDAVIEALQAGGLTAGPAYAGKAPRCAGPMAAVDVAEASGKPAAFSSYLGEVWDDDAGVAREYYGRRLEVAVSIEIRAPEADACETAMETAAERLLHALPSGLRCGELSWEAAAWDADNRLFLRRGRLRCQACFIARADAEDTSGALLEFILKGVLQS